MKSSRISKTPFSGLTLALWLSSPQHFRDGINQQLIQRAERTKLSSRTGPREQSLHGKSKKLCCNKHQFHGFYSHEFILHVPNLQFSIQEKSVTWCTICLTKKGALSLGICLSFKVQLIPIKSCLWWMLWTIFWTQQELEVLWFQCANQMNLAAIIQGKMALNVKFPCFSQVN